MHLGAAAGGALLAGDLLAACGGSDTGPLKIGLLAQGDAGPGMARMQSNCFHLAVQEINAHGGIAGRHLTTFVQSAKGGGRQAGQTVARLTKDDGVSVVIGGSAPVAGADAPSILIRAGSYDAGSCSKNVISTGQLPNQQIEPMAGWLLKNVGRHFFVVAMHDAWGRASMRVLYNKLKQSGHDLAVAWRVLPTGTTNFLPVLSQVGKTNADVLWSLVTGDAAMAFARQLAQVDVKAMVTTSGWNEVTAAAEPDLLVGAMVSQPWFMTLDTPESKGFVARYQRRFGTQPVSALGEATYDAVYLYKAAVEKAGTTSSEQVVKAFPEVQFASPQGLVRIDRGTQAMVSSSLLGQVSGQGDIEIHESLGSVPPALSDCGSG